MRTVKLDVPPEAEVLTYQMKAVRQRSSGAVVFPELCVEKTGRRFAYELPDSVQAFGVCISGEELSRAEAARDAAAADLADTLLDSDRILFSGETVYRKPDGEYIFLYYPADPVPADLCKRMLPVARQVTFETEMARSGEMREALFWVAAAVCCYILFVLLRNVTVYAWLVSLAAYGVICGGAALYAAYGAGRISVAGLSAGGRRDMSAGASCREAFFGDTVRDGCLAQAWGNPAKTPDEERSAEAFDDNFVPELRWDEEGTARLVGIFDPTVIANITKDDFRLGRNPDASDLQVPDRFVNPVHAIITRRGGDYAITDKCSRNGTFVNGTRIEPETPFPLYGNEEIRLGKEAYRFMITEE